jgi:16S rRNA (cytosine967-C5)-methyltransferase
VSPSRLVAFKILQRVEEDGAYASVLLAAEADNLKQNDRALCHELVMGSLRRQLWLDRLIAHYARRDSQRLDPAVRLALRLGLYQLRFLERIPAAAAVNESVNLVRLARIRSAEPFVNAVLRRAARERNYDPAADIHDPVERLAVETSHPVWLIERWANQLGFDKASAFARANNEVAPLAFRVAGESGKESAVLDALRSSGAPLAPSKIAPAAWRVTGAGRLLQKLVTDGQIYIQDEASQLVGHIVDPQCGDRVLDVCAAPGSKTTHIAGLAGRKSLIVAGDLHGHRLRTVAGAATTQRLSNIHCVQLDALQTLPFPEKSFERVLVDAPCTGTGTLRRNPEIRWRISPADIEDLSARQARILWNASQMVKLGGRLVYATCSIEPEENELVVSSFLGKSDSFRKLEIPMNSSLITSSGALRTWPHSEGVEGFFIAAFQRRN